MSTALLVSACHLVVSSGGGDGVGADEAGVEASECGDQTCGEGNVCCNASCGICTAPDNVCIQIACEPRADKTCDALRCSGSEQCMETPSGAVCVPERENPCNLVDCQPNSTCKVEQGAAVCVPLSGSGDGGAPIKKDAGSGPATDGGSSSVDAGSSTHDAGGPAPQDAGASHLDGSSPQPDASTPLDAGHTKDTGVVVPSMCATALCPTGTYCDDISGAVECLPLPTCATVKCSSGYHCELQQVVCIRAPCPPRPACVADQPTDPCGGKCKAGTHCEVIEVQCITTPCDPIAQCVANKPTCGCTGKGACLDIICPVIEES